MHYRSVIGLAGIVCLSACDREEGTNQNLVSLQSRQSDFVDIHGQKWIWVKSVVPGVVDVARTETVQRGDSVGDTAHVDPLDTLTAYELARKIHPRALRRLTTENGDSVYDEFTLAEPPLAVAQAILANRHPPDTAPFVGSIEPGKPTDGDVTRRIGKYIVGTDDRTYTADGSDRFNYPDRVFMKVNNQNCTATFIGVHAALSAAHCYYDDTAGGWIATTSTVPGADTHTPTAPNGTPVFDFIAIPHAWNHPGDWDWDFAALDYNTAWGNTLGYSGTSTTTPSTSNSLTMKGYPVDKPNPQLWTKQGTRTASVGSRYKHNLDVIPGDSGACTYYTGGTNAGRCIGIQSTQWTDNAVPTPTLWNEVRRWDSTTYNFWNTQLPHSWP